MAQQKFKSVAEIHANYMQWIKKEAISFEPDFDGKSGKTKKEIYQEIKDGKYNYDSVYQVAFGYYDSIQDDGANEMFAADIASIVVEHCDKFVRLYDLYHKD